MPKTNPKSNAALEVSDQADFFMTAPIADVAKNLNVSIDEAVNKRVEAVRQAERARAEMDVKVYPIEPQKNLHGFASVTIGGITVKDLKIVQNKDGGYFVGMPSRPDKNSESGYRNTVYVDKDILEDFNTVVIGKYHEAKERQAQERAAEPEKKTGMKKQIADAAKKAAEHNATKPPAKSDKDKNAEI